MEKITLKLSEFYQLEAELNGVTNQQTGEVLSKGLLSEKIKLTTKYWLHDLNKKVATEKESVEKLKDAALIDAETPVKTVTSPELIETVVISVLLKLT